MKLKTHPCIINRIFFLQPVDKALADIAERSDIVGKYFEVDHYLIPPKNLTKYTRKCLWLQFVFYKYTTRINNYKIYVTSTEGEVLIYDNIKIPHTPMADSE